MENFKLQAAQKLYEAAFAGDVESLLFLLQEDPLILDRCNIVIENTGRFFMRQSPLHVAVSLGHLSFTREILGREPGLTEEVDQIKRWSPLHTACAKGYLEVAKALISANPVMCLAPDIDGCNPAHVAAVRGQVHVLDALLKVVPQAARERINNNNGGSSATVLHLCVKHSQLHALRFLTDVMDDSQLLNSRDADGNTVLHLAVATKHPEMVKLLLKSKKIEKNAINKNGLTAMDIHIQGKKGMNDSEIRVALKQAKALKAKAALKPKNKHKTWLEKQRNSLMVVASLIATMAFQVGINPPGGVWQDNNGHNAGNSVMADVEKDEYDTLLIYNTAGLISSLSVILLLISGLPFKRIFVGILMITMWISVTATTLSYIVSVEYLSGNRELLSLSSKNHRSVLYALGAAIGVWMLLMILLLIGHALRFVVKLLRGFIRFIIRLCKGSSI